MKTFWASFLLLLSAAAADVQPRYVKPGDAATPPADAVVLFDGTSVEKFRRQNGDPIGCKVEDRVMVCRTGDGNAFSTEMFQDAQIHLEFNVPSMREQTNAQLRGNSGVYIHGRKYEVQILDSIDNPTYSDGVIGSVYGTAPPLVNAGRPAGEWQTYDIIFRGPRCSGAQMISPGTITVMLNGVLVQDHVSLRHPPKACIDRKDGEPGPLMLQDHSGFPNAPHTTMKFRNIWFRRLE